jgi:binding-protein-dependent transport system inner membrane component
VKWVDFWRKALVAGYYGGRVDRVVMRVMDVILAFPIYLLAIILMIMFAPTAGLLGIMKVTGAIAIVRIPIYARLVRGSVLSIKEKEYIEACHALGVRDPWILFGHVLPNCLAPIIVTTTLGIATSIIVEATLSFLGSGRSRRRRAGAGTSRPTLPSSRTTCGCPSSRGSPSSSPSSASTCSATASATPSTRVSSRQALRGWACPDLSP